MDLWMVLKIDYSSWVPWTKCHGPLDGSQDYIMTIGVLNLQQGRQRCPHPADYEVVKLEVKNMKNSEKNNSRYGPRRLVTRIVIIITMGHEKWSYWLFLYYLI